MSFPCYEKVREAGAQWIGELPVHWAAYPARRVFKQVREPALPGDEQLSASQRYGVIPQSLFMRLEDRKVALVSGSLATFRHVEKDDFVISLRSFEGGLEHCKYSGCVSPAYTVLRATHTQCSDFWSYALKSVGFVGALQSRTDGIRDGKSISYEQFGAVLLPVPLVAEQRAIATFLDRETAKIDAMIEEQRRLIALLDEKRQAVISHAVTKGLDPDVPMKDSGIGWLEEVPAHWDILPLRRVVRQFVDYRGATPTKVDDGVPLITATQIKHGRVDHTLDPVFITEEEYAERMTRGFPAIGDLLLTTEAPLGEAALVEEERVAPGQRIILMKMNHRMESSYLLAHFRSLFGQSELWTRASGSTASGIRADRLRASNVLGPPREEQQSIVRFIQDKTADFDEIKAVADHAARLLRERRSALISAAVTGKIDVRGLVADQAEAA